MPSGSGPSESPRADLRYALPTAMSQVTARLELVQVVVGPPMVGRLWDIGSKGGCIAIPGARQVPLSARGQLVVHDPMSHERHQLEVQVRWFTPLSHTTFIGVLFTGGPRPAQIFLSAYMSRPWTDRVPRSRLEL